MSSRSEASSRYLYANRARKTSTQSYMLRNSDSPTVCIASSYRQVFDRQQTMNRREMRSAKPSGKIEFLLVPTCVTDHLERVTNGNCRDSATGSCRPTNSIVAPDLLAVLESRRLVRAEVELESINVLHRPCCPWIDGSASVQRSSSIETCHCCKVSSCLQVAAGAVGCRCFRSEDFMRLALTILAHSGR